MNASPNFRYYLALFLLALLGLAIRVQNGASVTEQPAAVAAPAAVKLGSPLLAQQ